MSANTRKKTKATTVFEKIRQDIGNGLFLPGAKMQMDALKTRYAVGYSPLREALSRLVTHGLVTAEEQCGFKVAPLSQEELIDLYNIRIHIETLALNLSLEYGDEKWESDVVSSWYHYKKYLHTLTDQTPCPQTWDELNQDFRYNLIKACRSPWLLRIRELLYEHSARYRAVCLNNKKPNKKNIRELISHNENLVNAVLARDKKQAKKILEASWEISIKTIAKGLSNNKKIT